MRQMWSEWAVGTCAHLALTPWFGSGFKPRNLDCVGSADKGLWLLRMQAVMKGTGKVGTGSEQQQQGVLGRKSLVRHK